MKRIAATAYVTVLALGTSIFLAEARPIYTRKEKQPCGYCHVKSGGGGDRGFRGMFYGGNGLSFDLYDEKREAIIAGLAPNIDGAKSLPAISYNGNVTGPAVQQIQVAALRGPVILLFLGEADDASKAAVKSIAKLAKAYGTKATVLGVAKTEDALPLTDELGGLIRIYPDADGAAIKKFSATQALDIAVVAKLGDPVKTFAGFSRANVDAAIKTLTTSQKLAAPTFDLASVSDKVVRGEKL